MKKTTLTIAVLILILAAVFATYWYFFMNADTSLQPINTNSVNPFPGFSPIDRGSATIPESPLIPSPAASSTDVDNVSPADIPSLRLLSNTPVGGYSASTTGTSTVVRWIDRGRGNIYEARSNRPDIVTLSNTVLPRVYESIWNKNLTALIGIMLSSTKEPPMALYAELRQQSASSTSPYMLKGRNVSDQVLAYAVSPGRDKIFIMLKENGRGAGYVSNFDGSRMTRIFDTPLSQVNVEWPENDTLAVTTKGLSSQDGFLYFVNPKTGVWKKVLGPFPGLSTRTSRDAKYVMASYSENGSVRTFIHGVAKNNSTDAVVRTLADKCAWGNFYKNLLYCGVPAQPPAGSLPEDWYRGTISFGDKIWQIDAATGGVSVVSSIVDQSDRVIDAYNLTLSDKDDYLFFMNKSDLSLWSLDLISSN